MLSIRPSGEQALEDLRNRHPSRPLEKNLGDQDAERVIGFAPREGPPVQGPPPRQRSAETDRISAHIDVRATHQDRVHHEKRRAALETDDRTWSTSKLAEASGVLIELADVGLLPEEYEEQVRSFGYDLVRIAELIAAGP
jgi:hypothetical protein